MSTILETLKKLEEDKRLLEKDLNLKELVLREDQKRHVIVKIPHKRFIVVGLILMTISVAALIYWKWSPAKNEVTHFVPVPSEQKPASINRKEYEPTVGIPLSKITELRQLHKEKISDTLLPVINEPIREFRQPEVEGASPEINEIRNLIQTATSEAEQQLNPYPEELISRGISIPNLKVKGIIFFSSGSPSNHIFLSTLDSKNRKARVGDTIQSATLTHIESNRVVFSYKGETVHMRIGE
jgi:hypothetical protein